MASPDLFSLFNIPRTNFSKCESLLLEITLFNFLYNELTLKFAEKNLDQSEVHMTNGSTIRGLVNDLLINNEYSIEGLAKYTGYPEEIIFDLAAGLNSNPTLLLSTKIIELHAIARKDFYNELRKKIITKFQAEIKK